MHAAARLVLTRVKPCKCHCLTRIAKAPKIAIKRQQHRNRALSKPRNAVQQITLGLEPGVSSPPPPSC